MPKERDGVPIKVEEIENNHVTALTDAGCVNNYSFDKLWGGIILNTSQDAQFPIYPRGSTMCTARGPDGTEYCITANHLFSDGDGEYPCDANWDDFAYQHDDTTDDQYVGEVDKYHEDMDYARLPLANLGPKYDIASASWSGPVVGHASSTRLGELVENDTTCEKMGMKTGASQGPLTADSSDVTKDCWDTNNNAFQHHARTVVGDSGGPVYTQSESGDGISMIGLIAGTRTLPNLTTECGENTHEEFFGPPAWHMSDHWDLSFYKP